MGSKLIQLNGNWLEKVVYIINQSPKLHRSRDLISGQGLGRGSARLEIEHSYMNKTVTNCMQSTIIAYNYES